VSVTFSPDRRAKIGGGPWGHYLPTTEFTSRQLVDCFRPETQANKEALLDRGPPEKSSSFLYSKAHRNWQYKEWERVIWSDEASIQVGLDPYPRWLFRSEGEKFHRTCLKAAFKTSRQSIMVWACFHGDTKGTLIVFEKGSIDSLVYQNTLREGLLGLIEEEEGILETQLRPSSLIFMQDNAPIHKSNSTLEFLRSFNISPMAWPPNSPDLNPIENIWALFKKEFHSRWSARRAISSAAIKFPEMKTMLIESWEALPVELFRVVADSMPRRVRLALKASGGPINY